MTLTRILTLAALTGSALMGGEFFAYGNSVMASLERMPAGQGAATMNMVNVQIYNPLFMLVFMGTGLVCLALAVLGLVRDSAGRWWSLSGCVLYLVGAVITIAVNVPQSDRLAAVDPATREGMAEWSIFVASWTPANDFRAIACTLGVIAFGLALAGGGGPGSAVDRSLPRAPARRT
ncbi:DUF1772 domain-containing protein [Nonomuraea sp. KC401]|uniref:anthrone oxygenase family protein n=1 Tax=unclassified Nonomuraea TaxID=2593643 RepID=UPI0010FF16F0|nr:MULTISPECIES: anthrone oxygenase family protein [unclassified Nonomuraea]NBE94879.1 DUF1772 domain-containing protein [Nonomuraea sp. K271]TLF72263.1 DUF1772 domain-containing protein [Nonomuraea sp. KC401]